jgi:hypothetical protein
MGNHFSITLRLTWTFKELSTSYSSNTWEQRSKISFMRTLWCRCRCSSSLQMITTATMLWRSPFFRRSRRHSKCWWEWSKTSQTFAALRWCCPTSRTWYQLNPWISLTSHSSIHLFFKSHSSLSGQRTPTKLCLPVRQVSSIKKRLWKRSKISTKVRGIGFKNYSGHSLTKSLIILRRLSFKVLNA